MFAILYVSFLVHVFLLCVRWDLHLLFGPIHLQVSGVGIQLHNSLKEEVYTAIGFDVGKASFEAPAAVVEIRYQSAMDTLSSNILLSFSYLSRLSQLTPKLEMGSMLMLSQGLDEIFDKVRIFFNWELNQWPFAFIWLFIRFLLMHVNTVHHSST